MNLCSYEEPSSDDDHISPENMPEKIRHFPHIQGQWVTHISLEIAIEKPIILPNFIIKVQEYHISLSPLFSLQFYQVEEFKKVCEIFGNNLKRNIVSFDEWSLFSDASNIYNFVVLTAKNDTFIKSSIKSLEKILNSFKPKYLETFSEFIPHMSIGKTKSKLPFSHGLNIKLPFIGMAIALNYSIGGEKVQIIFKN